MQSDTPNTTHAKATSGNDENSHTNFLDLPRELRDEVLATANIQRSSLANRIFQISPLAVVSVSPTEDFILCCTGSASRPESRTTLQEPHLRAVTTLLLVSRQVNAEVWENFFRTTPFRLRIPNSPVLLHEFRGLRPSV